MATKKELIEKLTLKGIKADENMTVTTLTTMVKDLESATLSGMTNPELVIPADPTPESVVVEPTPLNATPSPEPIQSADRLYSSDEVRAMLDQVMKQKGADVPSPKDPNTKELRIARIEGKFVTDFRNVNTDHFIKKIIHAYNKFNEQIRQWEAWIDVVFEDGSVKPMPLLYLISNATPIVTPIIEVIKEDKSYSEGQVEKFVYKDNREGTGIMVNQKVEQYFYKYVVNNPETGDRMVLPQYVVNMV